MKRNALHGPSIPWMSEVGKCPINHVMGQQECNRGSDRFSDSPRSVHVTGLGDWETEGHSGDSGGMAFWGSLT